ncbi:hypothetical protein GNF77_16675 [Clostridium perfringens]|uniref:J domain-containing protein n=1 Tax=Clostridium perfringens TaxID=1502 RepID=A0AAW9IKN4_CLOPF|nr:hypothetical protein [Clostridium perfringens]MDZ5010500.1 hypothetical protein [Clostridium perfringens]
MLENIKNQYEASKEWERSYYENFKGNYNNYDLYGSYQSNKNSNHNEEDKSKYKKLYKTLAKAYHTDIVKDEAEKKNFILEIENAISLIKPKVGENYLIENCNEKRKFNNAVKEVKKVNVSIVEH